MLEIAATAIAGIVVGIFTGLLPALPVFTGPLLLLSFGNDMPVELMLIFWFCVITGSQFFSSIATITTKIPGEESSLIYIRDLDRFNITDLRQLLYSTAVGSTVAAMVAIFIIWVCLRWLNISDIPFLYSYRFQAVLYAGVILSFCWLDRRILPAIGLVMLGIFISPKSNYVIPNEWFRAQEIFQGYTFYLLILGTLVMPIVLNYQSYTSEQTKDITIEKTRIGWWAPIKNSLLGILAGLTPGPSASLGSILAYRITSGPKQKITAAETANNSAILASAVPLLALNLPINQNTAIMAGIMETKSLTMTESILTASHYFPSMIVIDIVVLIMIPAVLLYYWLSIHFIDVYSRMVCSLHTQMKWILFAILSVMIMLDLQSAEITTQRYFVLLIGFSILGLLLHRWKISPLPLLFGALLGDRLIWAFIQLFYINF